MENLDVEIATYDELTKTLADIHREKGEIIINNETVHFKIGDSVNLKDYGIFEITDIHLVYDVKTLEPVYKIWVKWLNGESRPINEESIIEIIEN